MTHKGEARITSIMRAMVQAAQSGNVMRSFLISHRRHAGSTRQRGGWHSKLMKNRNMLIHLAAPFRITSKKILSLLSELA